MKGKMPLIKTGTECQPHNREEPGNAKMERKLLKRKWLKVNQEMDCRNLINCARNIEVRSQQSVT